MIFIASPCPLVLPAESQIPIGFCACLFNLVLFMTSLACRRCCCGVVFPALVQLDCDILKRTQRPLKSTPTRISDHKWDAKEEEQKQNHREKGSREI